MLSFSFSFTAQSLGYYMGLKMEDERKGMDNFPRKYAGNKHDLFYRFHTSIFDYEIVIFSLNGVGKNESLQLTPLIV